MKLAEKLAAISDSQQTNEEAVAREIINFFAEKFENGEMMEAFEKSLGEQEIHSRKKNLSLDFQTYIPGCSETYFGLLGKEWKPEKDYRYEQIAKASRYVELGQYAEVVYMPEDDDGTNEVVWHS